MRIFALCLGLTLWIAGAQAESPTASAERNWGQWRGPLASGYAPHADPPIEWSETKNVRWKVPIPGHGSASPIVWGDRVYIQTAIDTERPAPDAADEPDEGGGGRRMTGPRPRTIYQFVLLALDRKTGAEVWRTTLTGQRPLAGLHADATQASSSPVTDGERIYAYFGSFGLYCVDLDGKKIWEKDLGDMRTRNDFGEGSSPALHGDTLVVQWDHEGEDFMVALDKRDGRELWRAPRDEITTWATPVILEADGKPQVVASATKRVRAYDLASGALLWECGGMTQNVIPSPIGDEHLLYAVSGFRGAAIRAIRYRDAQGDVTDSPVVAWSYGENTPYVPSALLANDMLYFLDNNRAILTCLDARTGEKRYGPERLEGLNNIYSSLTGARDRIYVVARDGKMLTLKTGSKLETLASSALDDHFDASPALVDKEIFLRGAKSLYCIAE